MFDHVTRKSYEGSNCQGMAIVERFCSWINLVSCIYERCKVNEVTLNGYESTMEAKTIPNLLRSG